MEKDVLDEMEVRMVKKMGWRWWERWWKRWGGDGGRNGVEMVEEMG